MSLQEISGHRKDKPAVVYIQAIKFDGDKAESDLRRWKDDATSLWNSNHWTLKKKAYNNKHTIENFACSVSRKKGCACPAKLRVRRPSHNQEIIVETTVQHSNHESTAEGILSPKAKQVIRLKTKEGKTGKLIQQDMMAMNCLHSVPKLSQIQNFMSREKREDSAPVTIEHLRDYAAAKEMEPNNEDEVYVTKFQSKKVANQIEFCLVWTTKKLKAFQGRSRYVNVDSTYKLNWNGYPVMVAGFSDANKRFFLTHIALSSNENTWCYEIFLRAINAGNYIPEVLMADGDQSITAAARIVWPNALRAMCFFHVMQNLRKMMKQLGLSKEIKQAMYQDVGKLQLASSETEFKQAARALMEYWTVKYAAQESVRVDFIDYFCSSWVLSGLSGWYEGFSTYSATNNGLESWNRVIKDCGTLRKLLLLRPFLQAAERIIENCSKCPDHQVVASVPFVPQALYREAHLLGEEGRRLYRSNALFVMPSKKVTSEDIAQHYDVFNGGLHLVTWEQYQELKSLFYVLRPSPIWPRFYSCTCYEGIKKGPCKHALFIMKKLGVIQFPTHAVANALGKKRKRGRPAQR